MYADTPCLDCLVGTTMISHMMLYRYVCEANLCLASPLAASPIALHPVQAQHWKSWEIKKIALPRMGWRGRVPTRGQRVYMARRESSVSISPPCPQWPSRPYLVQSPRSQHQIQRTLPLQWVLDESIIALSGGSSGSFSSPRERPFTQTTNEQQTHDKRSAHVKAIRELFVLAL